MAIECITDIGNHIVVDENLGKIDWKRDVSERLYENKIINYELKKIWIKMIGFRNSLIHDYIQLNRNEVYDILNNNLNDFKIIIKIFANYI